MYTKLPPKHQINTLCWGDLGVQRGFFTVNICTVWNNDSHYQPPLYAHHGLMPAPGVHRGGIPQCLQMTKMTPGCQIFEFWNCPSLPPICYLEHLQPDQLVHWTVHCLHHLSQNKTKTLHYGQTPVKNKKARDKKQHSICCFNILYYYFLQVFDHSGEFLVCFGSNGKGNGQFNAPTDLALDAQDNILVADWGNFRIQMTKMTSGCQIFEFWNSPSLLPICYLEYLQPNQLVHWAVHCLHHLSQNKTKFSIMVKHLKKQ